MICNGIGFYALVQITIKWFNNIKYNTITLKTRLGLYLFFFNLFEIYLSSLSCHNFYTFASPIILVFIFSLTFNNMASSLNIIATHKHIKLLNLFKVSVMCMCLALDNYFRGVINRTLIWFLPPLGDADCLKLLPREWALWDFSYSCQLTGWYDHYTDADYTEDKSVTTIS